MREQKNVCFQWHPIDSKEQGDENDNDDKSGKLEIPEETLRNLGKTVHQKN